MPSNVQETTKISKREPLPLRCSQTRESCQCRFCVLLMKFLVILASLFADKESEVHRCKVIASLRTGIQAYLILNPSFLNTPIFLLILSVNKKMYKV